MPVLAPGMSTGRMMVELKEKTGLEGIKVVKTNQMIHDELKENSGLKADLHW